MKIDYALSQLGDLRPVLDDDQKQRSGIPGCIRFRDEPMTPTPRFWRSLFHKFGLNDQVFRYFSYDEVFARVLSVHKDSRLRLCIERSGNRRPQLLAVSNPRKSALSYEQTHSLVRRYDDQGISYSSGILTSCHLPRSGEHFFQIGPDHFRNRYIVEVPIDGFGQPRIYLGLLRQICANGAVGYSRAFRSDIRMGEDAAHTLERALSQFDHEEGFAALRQRFDSAQKSWASVRETLQLQKILVRTAVASASSPPLAAELNRVAGDLHAIYGMANLETLSVKRQRVLPARCRVYDLLNFASEVATHRTRADNQTRLQAFIGTLISDEYDLEGTAERVPQFRDLFVNEN